MGGNDPYASSKACTELVTAAYRRSFVAGVRGGVASVRAGNVIGGGDWSKDRLVPDALHAFAAGRALRVRNPDAVRPWQHVLDPLHGYLTLAERLWADPAAFSGAWNFGPANGGHRPVKWLVSGLLRRRGAGAAGEEGRPPKPPPTGLLSLGFSK